MPALHISTFKREIYRPSELFSNCAQNGGHRLLECRVAHVQRLEDVLLHVMRKGNAAHALHGRILHRSSKADLTLPHPYLLFLGEVTDTRYAKTAFGLCDWARDRCVGEFALSASAVTTGLPRMGPAGAKARGARSLVIGVARPMFGRRS